MTKHLQTKIDITNGILKSEPMIKKLIVTDITLFTVITFSNINSCI